MKEDSDCAVMNDAEAALRCLLRERRGLAREWIVTLFCDPSMAFLSKSRKSPRAASRSRRLAQTGSTAAAPLRLGCRNHAERPPSPLPAPPNLQSRSAAWK